MDTTRQAGLFWLTHRTRVQRKQPPGEEALRNESLPFRVNRHSLRSGLKRNSLPGTQTAKPRKAS